MPIAGLALLIAGFYLGHLVHVSRILSERVLMWQSPWDNSVSGGDQVAQAIWAMAAGGPLGTGAGLGDSRYLPAGHTDLILAAVGEEIGIIGLVALALVAVVVDIQVVHADDYVVRPHLGVQADGGRRYTYNPRVLDVARLIPRGTVFDRRGLPLATDDRTVLERARQDYQKLGISLGELCPSSNDR